MKKKRRKGVDGVRLVAVRPATVARVASCLASVVVFGCGEHLFGVYPLPKMFQPNRPLNASLLFHTKTPHLKKPPFQINSTNINKQSNDFQIKLKIF